MIDEKNLNTDDLCQICGSTDCANCFSDEDFKEWIDSQPKVGEWIPVSERLPEYDDGLVLVTVNDKHNNLTFENALMTGYYCCVEGWILEGYLDWVDPNVTAWIPLPEPYKEQNDAI